MTGPVRLTLRMQPRPGLEQDFIEAWRVVADATSRVPGNLRQTLTTQIADGTEVEITSDWSSMEQMRRWERSDEQHELTARIRDLRQSASARVESIVHHVEAARIPD